MWGYPHISKAIHILLADKALLSMKLIGHRWKSTSIYMWIIAM